MRYRTIVVDPPWPYESWPSAMSAGSQMHGFGTGAAWVKDNQRKPIDYPTMTLGQIMALPVASLAESDGCHVYLWTTNKYLPRAFQVFDIWGVRYGQTLVWAKTPRGLGPGGAWAQSTEYCLVGRIGSLKWKQRLDSTWFNWPRQGMGSHSRKPEHFLDMVEQVSPGPYVELFARRHRLGWDVWGNESANTAELAV